MTDTPRNPDDYAVVHGYLATAEDVIQKLLTAYHDNRPDAAGYIAHQVHRYNNQEFLCVLLGQMTARIAHLDRQARESHGPLVTPKEVGYTPPPEYPVWHTAVKDQMDAAAQQRDLREFARVQCDGVVRAIVDTPPQGRTLESILAGMLLVDHQSTTVLAAECVRRLVAQQAGEE